MNRLNNLQQRLIVGIIGAGLLMTLLFYNQWTFLFLFSGIGALTLTEFYLLAGVDGKFPLKTFGTFSGVLLILFTFLVENGTANPSLYLSLFPLLFLAFIIKLYKKELKPFTNIAYTFLGILYVAIPFALLIHAAFDKGVFQPEIIAGMLFLLWASDSGAYFAGKAFGKRKLFERVSPKKTWEGSLGGGILALAVAFVLGIYFPVLPTWKWMGVAGIIVVFGGFGDLVESLFKRSLQVKDSGGLLPGHGGFLDRFDGLLLSAPFMVVFLEWT